MRYHLAVAAFAFLARADLTWMFAPTFSPSRRAGSAGWSVLGLIAICIIDALRLLLLLNLLDGLAGAAPGRQSEDFLHNVFLHHRRPRLEHRESFLLVPTSGFCCA